MNTRRLLTPILAALAAIASPTARSQVPETPARAQAIETAGLRIATVDMKRLFEVHPETKIQEKKVEEERAAIKAELRKETEALKSVLDSFQLLTIEIEKGGTEVILKPKRARASELAKKASKMERLLAEKTSQRETEVERRILAVRQDILDKIKVSIQEVNAIARYHLVIDSTATSGNGLPMVLDTRGMTDLTEKVIASFAK